MTPVIKIVFPKLLHFMNFPCCLFMNFNEFENHRQSLVVHFFGIKISGKTSILGVHAFWWKKKSMHENTR